MYPLDKEYTFRPIPYIIHFNLVILDSYFNNTEATLQQWEKSYKALMTSKRQSQGLLKISWKLSLCVQNVYFSFYMQISFPEQYGWQLCPGKCAYIPKNSPKHVNGNTD